MMTGRERPAVIAVLAEGYSRLFDRTLAVLGADERVRAVWLSGSVARGDADAASDLDFIVTVDDSAHAGFAAEWRDRLGLITDTVLAKPLGFAPGSFYCVTPDWLRLDVVVEKVSDLPSTFLRTRLAVLDRDGLAVAVPEPDAPAGPSPQTMENLVQEFFRIHGLLPVIVTRQDWLLGVEGVHTLRTLLYQLFVEANAPHPTTGLKKWSGKLTDEQRRLLESLPTGEASRTAVIDGHRQLVAAFRQWAPQLCERMGVAWPSRLEQATLQHVERQLGAA